MKENWHPPQHSIGYLVDLPDLPVVEVRTTGGPGMKAQYQVARVRIIHTWGEGRRQGKLETKVYLSATQIRGGKLIGMAGTVLMRQLSTVPSWLTDIIERSKPIV